MRILYKNIIDDIASDRITASSVITGYPVSNIQDQRLGVVCKSSQTSAFSIIFDFTQIGTKQVNSFALLGHNLTSSATVTIDFNRENSWPGIYQKTIAWNSGVMLNFFDETLNIATDTFFLLTESGDRLLAESGSTLVTDYVYEYAKLSISNPSNSEISIGRVWLGDYLQVSPSSLLDFTVTKKRSDVVIYGKDRQKFAIPGVGWRKFNFNFPISNSAMAEAMVEFYKTVTNSRSFIFCNFDTLRGFELVEPCYCSINGDLVFKHEMNMKFSYSLEFEEDK